MPGKHYLLDTDVYQRQTPLISFLSSAQTELREEEDELLDFEELLDNFIEDDE